MDVSYNLLVKSNERKISLSAYCCIGMAFLQWKMKRVTSKSKSHGVLFQIEARPSTNRNTLLNFLASIKSFRLVLLIDLS